LIETLQLIADEGKRSHYKGFSKEPPKVIWPKVDEIDQMIGYDKFICNSSPSKISKELGLPIQEVY
jgi:hypothetical protein